MHNGVTASTPAYLIDRIVSSNWVCLVGTFINFLGARANFANGYTLLLSINAGYQLAFVAMWYLNRSGHYLAARLTFLFAIYAGITFSCAIQGPEFQMQYYFLPFAVLTMSLFHPKERHWSRFFVVMSFVAFHFFSEQAGPILDIDPARGLYTLDDLRLNRFSYSLLLILSLLGLSNAYFRAIRLVDAQRTRTFYETRLSNLGLISGNVAHELNSPLAALSLHAFRLQGILQKSNASSDALTATDRIVKLCERIAKTIQSFKLLSDPTESETPQTTTLDSLFHLTTDLSLERLKRHSIALRIELHDPHEQLECQLVGLSQAFFCLIENAIEAISEQVEERWIRIRSRLEGDRIIISVTDSGPRRSKEIEDQMFDPFFTTKPRGRGIGMGLVIAQQTFASHGGDIHFDATSETTSFVVELRKSLKS